MKKLLLGALLIASVATPALAQSFTPEFGTANVESGPLASGSIGGQRGFGAYAYAPAHARTYGRLHRWASPTKEQFQTAPFQDENY